MDRARKLPMCAGTQARACASEELKQPRLDQFIIGFEHELFPNFSIGARGIFRDNKDFIENILINGEFENGAVDDRFANSGSRFNQPQGCWRSTRATCARAARRA